MSSAKLGQPPTNEFDLNVARWYMLFVGKANPEFIAGIDPKNGFLPGPSEPAGYVFETRVPAVEALGWFTFSLITILTIIRVSLPLMRKDIKWGWDDSVYILAFLVGQANNVTVILNATRGGAGQHIWDLTYHNISELSRWSASSQFLYYIALGLIKVSLTLWLLRAVGKSSKKWLYFIYGLLAVNVAYTIAMCVVQPAVLHPWYTYFNVAKAGKEGKIVEFQHFTEVIQSSNITNAILDFILVWVPAVLFFSLNVPWHAKLRLMLLFVFGLGTVATAIARAKVATLIQDKADQTWYASILSIVGFVEYILSFLVANAAALNTVYTVMDHKVRDSRNASRDPEKASDGSGSGSGSSVQRTRHTLTPKSANNNTHINNNPNAIENNPPQLMRDEGQNQYNYRDVPAAHDPVRNHSSDTERNPSTGYAGSSVKEQRSRDAMQPTPLV